MGNEASVILYRIKLRFNPDENEFKQQDDDFLAALDEIANPGAFAAAIAETHWGNTSANIMLQARAILKREWEITKRFFVWPWTAPN